jgi:allantoin racemase
MKIWHQSFTDLSRFTNYNSRLLRHAQRVVEPTTVVECHGLSDDTLASFGRSACTEHKLVEQVLQSVWIASVSGFDAVTIGCIYDPGLRAARSMVDIPVLGMAETTMLVGGLYGRRIGMISLGTEDALSLTELIASYGLSDRLAASEALDARVDELAIDEMEDPLPEPFVDSLLRAYERCIRVGADLVVAAEGVLNELIFAEPVAASALAARFLDANGLLWKQAEAAVAQRRALHLTVGRHNYYRMPAAGGDQALAARLGAQP